MVPDLVALSTVGSVDLHWPGVRIGNAPFRDPDTSW
jgi:hypothetical protein